MKKIQEFYQDMKDAVKNKDISSVNEKYIKPSYEASKKMANTAWNYVAETTPIVIEASKEAFAKGKEVFDKMQAKKNETKVESQTTTKQEKSEIKTEIKTEAKKSESKSDNKRY